MHTIIHWSDDIETISKVIQHLTANSRIAESSKPKDVLYPRFKIWFRLMFSCLSIQNNTMSSSLVPVTPESRQRLAAARMGCQTLLLTINVDTIGQMSCNPAIGGLAKGHLAREIDALGGEMGKTTDMTGLQFRMLNTKEGSGRLGSTRAMRQEGLSIPVEMDLRIRTKSWM